MRKLKIMLQEDLDKNNYTMAKLFIESEYLHDEILEMARLVKIQLVKIKNLLSDFDEDLAREIMMNERRINAQELKIDRDCENILALYNPVAIDLRFVIAALKINTNLERMGDNAESIAKYTLNGALPFDKGMITDYQIDKMVDVTIIILDDTLDALEQKDTNIARRVFTNDEVLNEINKKVIEYTIKRINEDPIRIRQHLYMSSIVHKLERIGDHAKNIAEEIIFYLEANVLKHNKEAKRINEQE